MEISSHDPPGLATGSIEGDGSVFLGANKLTIGTNNRSTTFAGIIRDGGFVDGSGGSLDKVGSGALSLSGANTYTGGTTINSGVLRANNKTGSATGAGPVKVNAGTLGGKGTMAGVVTVGTGSAAGAFLTPSVGAGKPATLTIQGALTFNVDASYIYKLDSTKLRGDTVIANGVTIQDGARFFFGAVTGLLPRGTVFMVIANTAAAPIAGEFSNLPDGSIFRQSGNTFRVSYEGGDGNDLTLAVQ